MDVFDFSKDLYIDGQQLYPERIGIILTSRIKEEMVWLECMLSDYPLKKSPMQGDTIMTLQIIT